MYATPWGKQRFVVCSLVSLLGYTLATSRSGIATRVNRNVQANPTVALERPNAGQKWFAALSAVIAAGLIVNALVAYANDAGFFSP